LINLEKHVDPTSAVKNGKIEEKKETWLALQKQYCLLPVLLLVI